MKFPIMTREFREIAMTVENKGPGTYQVSEDGMTVKTTSPAGEDRVLTLGDVEMMIQFFGSVRGQMRPAVPMEAAENIEGHPLQGLFVRHTSNEQHPIKNGAVFLARSEQFGWMEYPISPEMCQGFADWFAAKPEAICAPPGTALN